MHRGRTVLAMDCVLAGAEAHRGRPLNSAVRHHEMSVAVTIALIVGIVVLACAAVAGVGIWAKRQIKSRAPNSRVLARITPTGAALAACLTVTMVAGVAARKLAPDGLLGSFLSTEQGMLIAVVVGWLVFTVAATVLTMLGHPIAEDKETS